MLMSDENSVDHSDEPSDESNEPESQTIPADEAWYYAHGYRLPWHKRLWHLLKMWWRRLRS